MNKEVNYVTDFLFSTPDFMTGAGTVINIAGSFYEYNTSESEIEADELAICNDFKIVGQDMKKAIHEVTM